MQLDEFWDLFRKQAADTDWLQWVSTVLGIAEVLLARINNILLYPAGIVSSLIASFLLYRSSLYAEAVLNGYYVVMSIYGWWYWSRKKNEPPPPIAHTTYREWATAAMIVAGSFVLLYVLLRKFTPSTVPGWDAWVSA
ncbi:MAG TPA: nicotinamide riboside transporter PnuC, partial [Puia sp.]|nr:nicotinamide riboside transporter PnuC [Puia sp.]